MVSTSADNHAVSPVPDRHCCICCIIAWSRLKTPPDPATNPLAENPFPAYPEKPRTNVICFTNDPGDPT
jgi:hypothetical protein